MKRSAKVTLTVVAAVGLSSCGRRRMDPCDSATFNDLACQEAVTGGGYYWGGSWYPMTYHYPYPYYYDSYHGYVSRDGIVRPAADRYSRPAAGRQFGGSSAPHGVTRGGFGSTGASHAAGA